MHIYLQVSHQYIVLALCKLDSKLRDKRCIDMQIGVLQGKLFNNQRKHWTMKWKRGEGTGVTRWKWALEKHASTTLHM